MNRIASPLILKNKASPRIRPFSVCAMEQLERVPACHAVAKNDGCGEEKFWGANCNGQIESTLAESLQKNRNHYTMADGSERHAFRLDVRMNLPCF
jgi:hypothetical protein